jgi:hypothetical protein
MEANDRSFFGFDPLRYDSEGLVEISYSKHYPGGPYIIIEWNLND